MRSGDLPLQVEINPDGSLTKAISLGAGRVQPLKGYESWRDANFTFE